MNQTKTISIVAPVYNEEESVSKFHKEIIKVLSKMKYKYEVIYINDGSTDSSLVQLVKFSEKDENIKIISFSKNFGHQQAVTAGLIHTKGDAVVIIDSDLQDPPKLIPKLIKKWEQGYEVVNAKRKSRQDNIFKIITANLFYKTLNLLIQTKIPENVGDFRLLDKKVVEVLNQLPEKRRYIRGLTSWVGFKHCFVEFDRQKRFAGQTKYNLTKMLGLASNALFSFSKLPIQLARYLSIFCIFSSFIVFSYVMYSWTKKDVVPGWASQILIMLIFTSVNLIILSIISEYVSRIYNQVQGRPIFIIDKTYNLNNKIKSNES